MERWNKEGDLWKDERTTGMEAVNDRAMAMSPSLPCRTTTANCRFDHFLAVCSF